MWQPGLHTSVTSPAVLNEAHGVGQQQRRARALQQCGTCIPHPQTVCRTIFLLTYCWLLLRVSARLDLLLSCWCIFVTGMAPPLHIQSFSFVVQPTESYKETQRNRDAIAPQIAGTKGTHATVCFTPARCVYECFGFIGARGRRCPSQTLCLF
jgi:hypothetical protein